MRGRKIRKTRTANNARRKLRTTRKIRKPRKLRKTRKIKRQLAMRPRKNQIKTRKIHKTRNMNKKAYDAVVTGVDISDILEKVKASRKTTTKNCAHSRIYYKPAISRAVAEGFSVASAKLWASETCTAFLARYNFKEV